MAPLNVALLIIVSVLVVCAGAEQSFAGGPPVFDSGTSFAITPEMYNQI